MPRPQCVDHHGVPPDEHALVLLKVAAFEAVECDGQRFGEGGDRGGRDGAERVARTNAHIVLRCPDRRLFT